MVALSPSASALIGKVFGADLDATQMCLLNQIISESDILKQDLNDFSEGGGQIIFGTTSRYGAEFTYVRDTPTINIVVANFQSVERQITNVFATKANSEALSGTNDALIGSIVGALAHELGHFENSVGSIYSMKVANPALVSKPPNVIANQAEFVADDLLSEGLAVYNNLEIAQQIAFASAGQTQINVNDGPTDARSQELERQLLLSPESVAVTTVATEIALVVPTDSSGTINATNYLEGYWNRFTSALNQAGLTGLQETLLDVTSVDIATGSSGLAMTLTLHHTSDGTPTYDSVIDVSKPNAVTDEWVNDNTGSVYFVQSITNTSHANTIYVGNLSATFSPPVPTIIADGEALSFANSIGGNEITFGAYTLSAPQYGSAPSTVDVSLNTPLGVSLGILTFNTVTDTDSFTVANGMVINLPGIVDNVLADPDVGAPPLQILSDYLSDLLDPLTTVQLSALNYAYLNPTGTAYDVTGFVQATGTISANVFYEPPGEVGAIVEGQDTAIINVNGENVSVAATNILYPASGSDISQDSISGMQILYAPYVTLTSAQFNSFGTIMGLGNITVTTGGTDSIAGSNVTGNIGTFAATGWDGTTLIGSNQVGQTLTASLFGNDTLEAGNGAGDILNAGEGVDTLVGGNGGDTFVVNHGLAAGSVITGNGGANILNASGDISQASVSGIQTLQQGDYGTVMLSAVEFEGFSTIEGGFIAATGGIYSFAGKAISGHVIAASADDTTVTDNDVAGGVSAYIVAAGAGNDTLTAGSATGDYVSATGSGNDLLTVGDGAGDSLSVSGAGNDTLTAGDGGSDTLTATGPGNDMLTAGDGANDLLTASGGTDTLTAGQGDNDTVSATTGGNTLIVGDGTAAVLSGGGGNSILKGGDGGDTFNIFGDYNQAFGGSGDDTFNMFGDGNNDDILDLAGTTIDGGGGFNTLYANGDNLDISQANITNIQTINATSVTLTVSELTGLTFGVTQATVADTAANVASNFPILETLISRGEVGAIIITDAGTLPIDIAGGQFTADAAVLNLIGGEPVVIDSTGTAIVSGNAPIINLHANTLWIGDTGAASLTISGDNEVGAGEIDIGVGSTGAGTVTVDGYNSALSGVTLAVGGSAGSSGGTGQLTISNGAAVYVSDVKVWGSGIITLAGGDLETDPVEVSGGTITGNGIVTGDITDNGNVVASGGTLELTGNITGGGTLTITSGSTLLLDGAVGSGAVIKFESGGTGKLELADQGDMLGSIVGQSPGDSVTDVPLCFLPGTMIATPPGETPVERLVAGDLIRTASGEVRPITWIGKGRVLATRGRRNAATPVIIRKGALADNVPHKDLRVTKAHALYVDDVLIPVEFLVNHRSILWDDHAQEVTLYHIELETHDVLLADGAPAESYRDDANRWLFQNSNSGWDLPPQEPCAPVLTGGPLVDAAWRRLLDRSGPREPLPLTDDADMHLLVDGQRLDAATQVGDAHVFYLPAVPSDLRIISRAAVATELGLARDPRTLGVALRRLAARQGTRFQITEAKDDRLTAGFHGFEADNGFRWTDGDASIPADLYATLTAPLELVLHIGATTRYLADVPAQRVA